MRRERALVARFRRLSFTFRLILIWLFASLVLIGIYAATRDPLCQGVGS